MKSKKDKSKTDSDSESDDPASVNDGNRHDDSDLASDIDGDDVGKKDMEKKDEDKGNDKNLTDDDNDQDNLDKNPTDDSDDNDKDKTPMKHSSSKVYGAVMMPDSQSVINRKSPSSNTSIHPASDVLMNGPGRYIFFVVLFQAYSHKLFLDVNIPSDSNISLENPSRLFELPTSNSSSPQQGKNNSH